MGHLGDAYVIAGAMYVGTKQTIEHTPDWDEVAHRLYDTVELLEWDNATKSEFYALLSESLPGKTFSQAVPLIEQAIIKVCPHE
jgi:hypothetical protein